jgi:predicted cupin superfamily sugar epimerase
MESKGLTDIRGTTMTTSGGEIRNVSTSILYMLSRTRDFQAWVANASDHVHFHHGGGAFIYHIVSPDGKGGWRYHTKRCGGNVANGDEPQVVVPGGSFKAARLEDGYDFGIVGEAVAPGFDSRDFAFVSADELKTRSAVAHAAAGDLLKIKPKENPTFQSFYED